MAELQNIFQKYDRILIFDTETTGLHFHRDEIIEFAAVAVENQNGKAVVVTEYDELISLSPGLFVPPFIEKLTGISTQMLREQGLSKERVAQDIASLITPKTLLMAYNAHFDLCFLYYFLMKHGDFGILKGKDKIDLLTVYRDRRAYPHKLCNAIEAYNLQGKVVNSHRAVDDVLATVEVLKAMDDEKSDLEYYVNLFGYIPKFGVDGKRIASITYRPQPYDNPIPLYEVAK